MFLCLVLWAFQSTTADVVTSGVAPAAGAARLVLTEDLRLAGQEPGLEWTGSNSNLVVNDAGEIFLADTGSTRILAFDPTGKNMRVIAKNGKEPGQLSALDNIALTDDGGLIALEGLPGQAARFHHFDRTGAFVRTVTPPQAKILRTISFDPKGQRLAGTWLALKPGGSVETRMGLLAADGAVFETLLERQDEFMPEKFGDRNYLLDYMAHLVELTYGPKMLFAFDREGRYLFVHNDAYRITRRDFATGKERVLEKAYAPIPNDGQHVARLASPLVKMFMEGVESRHHVTKAFVGEMLTKAKLPESKQPIFGLIPMEHGGLLVVHDIDLTSGSQMGHVFDGEGRYTGDLRMERQSMIDASEEVRLVFRKDHAYTLETQPGGFLNLVRYRVSWEKSP